MTTISVGDSVEVVNRGDTYNTYSDWSGVANGHVVNFVNGDTPENGAVYKITYIGMHGNGITQLFVLDHQYIVNIKAFKLIGEQNGLQHSNFKIGKISRARTSKWCTACNHFHISPN